MPTLADPTADAIAAATRRGHVLSMTNRFVVLDMTTDGKSLIRLELEAEYSRRSSYPRRGVVPRFPLPRIHARGIEARAVRSPAPGVGDTHRGRPRERDRRRVDVLVVVPSGSTR